MISFTKMHGLGNDFVILDNRGGRIPALCWSRIADRHFGVGCDQIVVMEKSDDTHVFMRIYNADGGEVASCGNASRAVALYVSGERRGIRSQTVVTIKTLSGIVEAYVKDSGSITIDMGEPHLAWQKIPLKSECDTLHLNIANGPLKDPVAVSMGNPHMVFFVPDVDAINLASLGPVLEHHPLFPERANVGIVHIESKERMSLRVWERGAGLTLACGTGACAALVAAHLRGLSGRKAQVKLPGGVLEIEWRKEDDRVLMAGPAAVSFIGELDETLYR